MLLQSVVIVARKLLVDEKITACVKYASRVLYVKFQKGKIWLVKHFSFLKNVCYQHLNVVLQVTYCFFYKLLIGPQPTFSECIVITCISCNPIGQLCLSGPGYTCRTLMWLQVTTKTWQSHLQWMKKSLKLKWVVFLLR